MCLLVNLQTTITYRNLQIVSSKSDGFLVVVVSAVSAVSYTPPTLAKSLILQALYSLYYNN